MCALWRSWRANIPFGDATGLLPGALLRYAVTALDANGGQLARKPSEVDTDGQARRERSTRRANCDASRWRC